MGDLSPLDSPTGRRSVRNSLSGGSSIVPGGVGIGLGGGATGANSMSGMGIGNGLSLAGMAAGGGMAAAANAAASSLSTLAASANIVDRCGSAGANIISGSAAGIGGSHSGERVMAAAQLESVATESAVVAATMDPLAWEAARALLTIWADPLAS